MMLCSESGWSVEELVQSTLNKTERRKEQYHTLGRKTKVALLGGAFNPPTIGHLRLAQFILDTSKNFDEVWFVPCYQHMYNKELVTPEHRLAMCNLLCANDCRIKTFDYEIKNQLRGETYHFVKRLLDEDFAKDQYDFSMIIGLDNANTFDKWVNYEDLEKMMRFVVVSRQGTERDESVDWYLKPPHIYLYSGGDVPEISSTEIRRCIVEDDTSQAAYVKEFMDDGVWKYLCDNELY